MEIRGMVIQNPKSTNPKSTNGNQGYRRPNWSDLNIELLDALC